MQPPTTAGDSQAVAVAPRSIGTAGSGTSGTDWPQIAMFVVVGLVLAGAAIVVATMAGVAVAFSRRGEQHGGPRY